MAVTREQRIAAVKAMYATVDAMKDPTAEEVAREIRKLSGVVRSAKWNDAVERYATFVEVNADRSVGWAYAQGSVYFAHSLF